MIFSHIRATLRCAGVLALALTLYASAALPAWAQTAGGRVSGRVVDQTDSLPLAAADVSLYRNGVQVKTVRSGRRGDFVFDSVDPGLYVLSVDAAGYANSRSNEFVVATGQEVTVSLAVNKSQTQQTGDLKTIGRVSATTVSPLASTTTISRTIDPVVAQKENNIRLVDSLVRLPGVNGAGLSSSIGDDTYINIRGLGESETVALLDGHPVGPQGVYGINGGGTFPTSFNYANTPIFGLNKVQVTFGSGASGLYGVDAIGGTVDLQTLVPSEKPSFNWFQGAGDQGRLQSDASFTGTSGRFAYALAGGVQGGYGLFFPQQVSQTGRPNNNSNLSNGGACLPTSDANGNSIPDVSSCNLALNTYNVSQNTTLKAGLAKLRYNLSNNTSFTSTIYSSGQRADSTGNGDNDNIPYDTRYAQINANLTKNCALPTDTGGATSGYLVTNNGGLACYNATQLANASYGPFGGGQDRNRGTNMADYHFRLQSTGGKNTITADGFYNNYKYYKDSVTANGLDPTGTVFSGTLFSQFLNTSGWLLSDDIQNERSDIGFGYFGQYQLGTRLNKNVVAQGIYNYNDPEQTHYNSGFLRGQYEFNPYFSTFASFWIKNSSSDRTTSFDPRFSLVFRPAVADVVRLTYGHSTGDPAAELTSSNVNITGNPSSLNPSCTPFNGIANGGNPNIRPEEANDYEVGYAHKFQADSSIQLNLYYTRVNNQLFSASLPILQYGSPINIPADLLAGYASKIASAGCSGVDPGNPATVLPFLSIATTFNAASAVSKGIEITGRQRLTRQFYFDYSYNLQSVVQTGVSDNILQNNPFIINGGQVQGIPLNQANLGVDYANKGLEMRMDGYFVGPNNPKSQPAYNTWDGFVSKQIQQGLSLTLGVQNVFNQNWLTYGYFGHQQFIPENHFFNDTNPIQQFLSTGSGELYGVPVRSFLLSVSQRV